MPRDIETFIMKLILVVPTWFQLYNQLIDSKSKHAISIKGIKKTSGLDHFEEKNHQLKLKMYLQTFEFLYS